MRIILQLLSLKVYLRLCQSCYLTCSKPVHGKYMSVYGIIEGQKQDLGRHDHIVLKRIISFKDIISLLTDVKTLG